VRGDLTGRQALGRQRDHQLVDAGEPRLPLRNDLRLERALTVPGHRDLDLADLGQHRLRRRAVARVAPITSFGRVPRIAEMVLHLDLKRRLGQTGQKPARPDQLDTCRAGPLDQLLSELLIRRHRHHLRRCLIRHYGSLPPATQASKSGLRSHTVNPVSV
jgi:hypothetical protein